MVKYWLKYSKTDHLKYVGHLDILGNWERILRRAAVPLRYSQGFNRRPVLSLAAPLPVGLESMAEYLELEVSESLAPAALQQAVSRNLPTGMELLDLIELQGKTPSLMSLVRYADYHISLPDGQAESVRDSVDEFLASESCEVLLQRKQQEKLIDIRPLVIEARVEQASLHCRLATGSAGNLRPEAFLQQLGVAAKAPLRRTELYVEAQGKVMTPRVYSESIEKRSD